MNRLPFSDIFQSGFNLFLVKQSFRVQGITIPKGFEFPRDSVLCGMDWALFSGYDLVTEVEDGAHTILGILKKV